MSSRLTVQGRPGTTISLSGQNDWSNTNLFSATVPAPTNGFLVPVIGVGTGVFDLNGAGLAQRFATSSSGAAVGINMASGFAGDLIDAQVAGTQKFTVGSSGAITGKAQLNLTSTVPSATTFGQINIGDGGFFSTGGSFFAGAGPQTAIAVNCLSSSFASGSFVDFQLSGVSKWRVDASGNLTTTGTLPAGNLSGLVGAAHGGTGLDASAAANGALLIGNGSGLSLATLTAGTGVSITNGAGTITIGATGSGGGTVTSVALSLPADFSVSGSPVTSSGTLTATRANQSANTVLAGPGSGAAAAPTYRALVAGDLPAHATTHDPGGSDDLFLLLGSSPTARIETVPRYCALNANAPTSGAVYFTYFTPNITLTVSTLSVATGGTVASGLTHFQMGLYTVDGSNNLTLVAQTTDSTTGLSSANTAYGQAISKDGSGATLTSYTLNRGTRYAFGLLIAASTTMPALACAASNAALVALAPVLMVRTSGTANTAVPTSQTYSAGVSSALLFYGSLS